LTPNKYTQFPQADKLYIEVLYLYSLILEKNKCTVKPFQKLFNNLNTNENCIPKLHLRMILYSAHKQIYLNCRPHNKLITNSKINSICSYEK
jgi:hypothetical protein